MIQPTSAYWVDKMFKTIHLFLLLFIFSGPLIADPDIKVGKALLKEHCYSCHGDEVYLREKKLVTSYPKLIKRVRFCSLQRNLTWFDEDIENVASYLNQQFYHFKP